MNRVALKLTLSTAVIKQLAGQAASLVAAVDRQDRLADGAMRSGGKQPFECQGWAFGGWEPPPEPTGIPGL